VDGFLGGVHIVGEGGGGVLFVEGDLVVEGVVGDLDGVSSGELEGFELAVELHLVAIPGVSVGADQVVAVVGVGVAEVEVDPLHAVQMGHPHPNPRGQLLDPDLPLLHRTAS